MPRRGRPWSLPLGDGVLLVTAYWRTNLTLRQVAPLFEVSKSNTTATPPTTKSSLTRLPAVSGQRQFPGYGQLAVPIGGQLCVLTPLALAVSEDRVWAGLPGRPVVSRWPPGCRPGEAVPPGRIEREPRYALLLDTARTRAPGHHQRFDATSRKPGVRGIGFAHRPIA